MHNVTFNSSLFLMLTPHSFNRRFNDMFSHSIATLSYSMIIGNGHHLSRRDILQLLCQEHVILIFLCFILTSLAKEAMFSVALACLSVCLFVCLCARNITQKVMNGSQLNFMGVQRGKINKWIDFSGDNQNLGSSVPVVCRWFTMIYCVTRER